MIRGKAAEEDMAYVENFCKDKGIKCYSFSYDVEKIANDEKLSCEEAGRMVRYKSFYQVMEKTGSNKIAVAHNAGDSAETILHNLFRGTGIKGLTGIVPKRDAIIRPLLCLDREEIEKYLSQKGIEYRIDATNSEDIYTRNKIRNTILTYAKNNINSNAVKHVTMAGQMLAEVEDFVALEGAKHYEKCVKRSDKIEIAVKEFDVLHNVIKKYIIRKAMQEISGKLKDITHIHVESVLELFENVVGKSVNLPYDMLAKKMYDCVIIENCQKSTCIEEKNKEKIYVNIDKFGEFSVGENGEKLIVSAFSKEDWDLMENKYEEKIYTKWLDCGILDRNLVIRTRETGDYIVVDNKGSRKKIKDIFIDMKIPKESRDRILLLADGNEILWIIGHRINYNYKITEDTSKIIKLEYIE